MKKIIVFDTTLRDGEQSPGCSMNLTEKVEVARRLESMGVDVIEAGFAIASKGDFEGVAAVANTVKNSAVASLARALNKDIDAAYDALKNAASPRIHTFLATSPTHMQYKLRMTEEQVLERVAEAVSYAHSKVGDVEFSAEDAMRSDKAFLARVIEVAIKSGAKTVNIPDTVGYRSPSEVHDYITYLINNVPNIDKAVISIHCHNDLGLAVANTLVAVQAGAGQVECTLNGIGERAGNAALEEIVMNLKTRQDYYNVQTNIDSTQIYRACRLVQTITGVSAAPTKPIVGANAFAHESGIHQHGVLAHAETYEIMTPASIGIPSNKIVIGKHSGRHAFEDRLKELGYKLSQDELNSAFERFKVLADKKKVISDGDLEALLADKLNAYDGSYTLDSYSITRTSNGVAKVVMTLLAGDEPKTMEASGNGPIEACFNAVNQIIGRDFELDDYTIRAATEGDDAIGEAVVRLVNGEQRVTGRANSVDTIEASIIAYLNGINKCNAI